MENLNTVDSDFLGGILLKLPLFAQCVSALISNTFFDVPASHSACWGKIA